MVIMSGYWYKTLRVNLTDKSTEIKETSENLMKKTIGGSGFGAYILLKEVPENVSPLSPENMIIFATGPFQASKISGVGKWTVASKSPSNGYYGESSAGGDFGINLKKNGFDSLIISGKSQDPACLHIEEDSCEIREANDLWGLDSFESAEKIRNNFGSGCSIATIGIAGENLVRFACIVVDKHSFAGRSGMGAVLGSKNLKGIVIKNGGKNPPISKPEKLKKIREEISKKLAEEKSGLRKHGTPQNMDFWEETGDIPVKNWRKGSWSEGNKKLGAPRYSEKILEGRKACKYCLVGCHRHVKVEEPEKYGMEGPGPEYETLAMIGENCLIDDLECVAKANDLCNRFGLDTITVGSVLGFLMEAFEKGYLENESLEIDWGDGETALEIIEMIGERRGLGDIFAEGLKEAVEEINPEMEEFAVQVKNVEIPAHDPRAHFAVALNYVTGVRGAGHERGNLQMPYHGNLLPEAGILNPPDRFSMDNIEYLTAKYQDWSSLYNSLVMCRFMIGQTIDFKKQIEILNAITGWGWDAGEGLKAGERIFNLQRLVNTKFGLSRNEEKLPDRLYQTTKEGGHAGKAPENLEPYLQKYYELRGWDEQGKPKKEKLKELGLTDILKL